MKDKIRELKADEINDVFLAVLARYRELFPDWEMITLSLEKAVDKNEQLEQIIASLENMKDK